MMILADQNTKIKYHENFLKAQSESKRMFAKRIASILFTLIKQDTYLNLDELAKLINNELYVQMILRQLSFQYEKYHINQNKQQQLKIITNNQHQWKKTIAMINAVAYVRELQDMPQNILTPKYYESILKRTFGKNVTTIKADDLKKMQLFNGVGNSSNHKQSFVVIEHIHSKSSPIVLVGKGITYDSGGYNLKSGKNLLGMKADMSGSAIVVGVMKLLQEMKISKNVIALLPLANNDLSINSIQPQMVLQAYDGTYVEIKNTDAEGRLVNADAIAYAVKNLNPKSIIEISTLTGSITSVLDNLATGLFTNDIDLGTAFIKHAKPTGEKFTLLQRFKEVTKRLYESTSVADIANVDANQKMSSLYAFEFLNHFANNVPLLHLDVAGTAVLNRDRGTGEGTLSIFEYIKNS